MVRALHPRLSFHFAKGKLGCPEQTGGFVLSHRGSLQPPRQPWGTDRGPRLPSSDGDVFTIGGLSRPSALCRPVEPSCRFAVVRTCPGVGTAPRTGSAMAETRHLHQLGPSWIHQNPLGKWVPLCPSRRRWWVNNHPP